jgi:selenocysteine-specific elongation factor
VQVHGTSVSRAQSGQRTAVNLAGVDIADIERGMVLAESGRLRPTQVIDVELTVLASAPRAVRTRSRIRVHIGSAEVLARVRVLSNRGEIEPGATNFAQLRLEAPVTALHAERFIVRSYSPAQTIGGGVVLNPLATKHRGKELSKTHERLRALMNSKRPAKLAAFVELSGDAGLRLSDVAARLGWNDHVSSQVALEAKNDGAILEAEGTLITREVFERLCRLAVDEVEAHHRRDPLSRGLARETLRERHFAHAPVEAFRWVIAQLESTGALTSEKDLVRVAGHALELSPADENLRQKLAATYEKAGLGPPSLDQALEDAGVSGSQRAHARKILQLLIDSGTLVRVHGEMFFHVQALDGLKKLLRQYASENEPERLIDVAKFKDLAGISRKYAIPLLEYLDRERVTRRAGDKRIILI